jgi:hypothetical protein
MVDVMRVKPLEHVRDRPVPCNLKRSSRCRPAAGAAGGHIWDNHKSQDLQARISSAQSVLERVIRIYDDASICSSAPVHLCEE